LESEQKTVKKRIKENVLDVVDKEYDSLVALVKGSEQSRQSPIDVWETKKKKESEEKARLEQERIDKIKAVIKKFRDDWESVISDLVFGHIDPTKEDFEKDCDDFIRDELAEFDVLFDREVSYLTDLLNSKIKTLTEQEQIRIDNLLIQEKNAEQSRIQEWQRTWNANIDTLSFGDIADVKSILVKSKLANLKHYVSGYEEIYNSTEKRLHSQIEFVSKAEEQRIAQEKLDQEKKEFEEKQLESKFQERKKFLVDEGYWNIYFTAECFERESTARLNLLNFDDAGFENFKLAVLKAKTPVEEIEVVADEVVELPALEVASEKLDEVAKEQEESYKSIYGSPTPTEFSGIFPEPSVVVGHKYVDPTNVLPLNTTDKIEEIANHDAFIQTEEMLYHGIYKNVSEHIASFELTFRVSDLPKFEHLTIKELLEPYNVPSKKQ
jgi:hypothetical protein